MIRRKGVDDRDKSYSEALFGLCNLGMLIFGLCAALLLVGCTALPVTPGGQPGFFQGFFQGFVAMVTLVGSLFFHIPVYTSPNSGFRYDIGFMSGFGTSILMLVLSLMPRIGGYITTRRG